MADICKIAILSVSICFFWLRPAFSEQIASFACNEFPPYKMQNSASGLPGFDVEFLDEAFKRVGISLQIQFMPWKRALVSAKQGKIDGVCSCSKTKDREGYLEFSEPLGKASAGLFSLTARNYPKLQNIEEIGPLSVGTIAGYNLLNNLEAAHIKNAVKLDTERQGLSMLLKGRIDYYYSYKAPAQYYLTTLERTEEVSYHELSSTDYFVCFSKVLPGTTELLKKFNTGLAEIKADGTYNKILDKYR